MSIAPLVQQNSLVPDLMNSFFASRLVDCKLGIDAPSRRSSNVWAKTKKSVSKRAPAAAMKAAESSLSDKKTDKAAASSLKAAGVGHSTAMKAAKVLRKDQSKGVKARTPADHAVMKKAAKQVGKAKVWAKTKAPKAKNYKAPRVNDGLQAKPRRVANIGTGLRSQAMNIKKSLAGKSKTERSAIIKAAAKAYRKETGGKAVKSKKGLTVPQKMLPPAGGTGKGAIRSASTKSAAAKSAKPKSNLTHKLPSSIKNAGKGVKSQFKAIADKVASVPKVTKAGKPRKPSAIQRDKHKAIRAGAREVRKITGQKAPKKSAARSMTTAAKKPTTTKKTATAKKK